MFDFASINLCWCEVCNLIPGIIYHLMRCNFTKTYEVQSLKADDKGSGNREEWSLLIIASGKFDVRVMTDERYVLMQFTIGQNSSVKCVFLPFRHGRVDFTSEISGYFDWSVRLKPADLQIRNRSKLFPIADHLSRRDKEISLSVPSYYYNFFRFWLVHVDGSERFRWIMKCGKRRT